MTTKNDVPATENSEPGKRGRKPSDAHKVASLDIYRGDAISDALDIAGAAEAVANFFGANAGYSVRSFERTGGFAVKVQDATYQWPAEAKRGARISPENAALLQNIAAATGQSADDLLTQALKLLVGTNE